MHAIPLFLLVTSEMIALEIVLLAFVKPAINRQRTAMRKFGATATPIVVAAPVTKPTSIKRFLPILSESHPRKNGLRNGAKLYAPRPDPAAKPTLDSGID